MRYRALLFGALLCIISMAAFAAPIKFPPLTGRVVDQMHVLSQDTVTKLTNELAAHEQKTGQQVVVAIVSSLDGHEIEDYGYQLGRFWGIGQKDKNTGAILIVAPNERKVRIEVGYGLEGTLTDAQSNQIIYQTIIPDFKAGQLEQGVVAGTEEILGVLEGGVVAPDTKDTQQPTAAPTGRSIGGGISLLGFFLFFIILRLIFGGWWFPIGLGMGMGGRSFGGGGGFSGGGGSFGGGGASGSW